MQLKQRGELTEREQIDYARAYTNIKHKHLRELTIAYNVSENDSTIFYCGVINPFIGEISPLDLAMACGYWKHMIGGSAAIDHTGGFEVVIKKNSQEFEYFW